MNILENLPEKLQDLSLAYNSVRCEKSDEIVQGIVDFIKKENSNLIHLDLSFMCLE